MRASLADQACTLAIGIGANLPSPAGEPFATLLALRPLLAEALAEQWGAWGAAPPALQWSPLFCTAPVGGPPGQPDYFNAVLLAEGEAAGAPDAARAEQLLERLQGLELQFGRERSERWGPRSLDLDLLWWGDLQCRGAHLVLPHPLWRQRPFVLAPLAALRGETIPPDWPQPLPGCAGWPE